jgi:hypothetical protein
VPFASTGRSKERVDKSRLFYYLSVYEITKGQLGLSKALLKPSLGK